ncbi:hypothetical protein HYY69_08190 [Candidatus Woesearchaeota archaeon]|nr:hypothetical protein [Candidatus Woesearchaeota archaeon]
MDSSLPQFDKLMTRLIIEKCKTRAAISCRFPDDLRHKIKLDLAELKKRFSVKSDAGIALVLEIDSLEIIVHGYGELLFKTIDPAKLDRIEKIAHKIYKAGLDF